MRSQLLVYLSQKLDIALLLGYYDHVLKLPMNFFGTVPVGTDSLPPPARMRAAASQRKAVVLTVQSPMIVGFGIMSKHRQKIWYDLTKNIINHHM